MIARQYESYHGIQVAKEAFLEIIMTLQPARMYHRAVVPLLLIQIGRDNEAYNFIKFWLKNTPKGIRCVSNLKNAKHFFLLVLMSLVKLKTKTNLFTRNQKQ